MSYIRFDTYQQHKKKSFLNRCHVVGANGVINLSVPLVYGRSQAGTVKEIRIANSENWQLRHFRSLVSSYNNSPWFKHYSDDLAALYRKQFNFIIDWDLACFEWVSKILKLELAFGFTQRSGEGTAAKFDLRETVVPGKTSELGITSYPQVFENKFGFIPGLSILDLLFCEGPKGSLQILQTAG